MITFLATYWVLFLIGTCVFIGLSVVDDNGTTSELKGLFCGILGIFCGLLTVMGYIGSYSGYYKCFSINF